MTVYIKDFIVHLQSQDLFGIFTAISRKVVGKSGFEFAVLQRNLKEWHERSWTYAMAQPKFSKNVSKGYKQERIKGTEKASPIHTLFHR